MLTSPPSHCSVVTTYPLFVTIFRSNTSVAVTTYSLTIERFAIYIYICVCVCVCVCIIKGYFVSSTLLFDSTPDIQKWEKIFSDVLITSYAQVLISF